MERITKLNRTIENLAAKVELAEHNIVVLRLTIDNQEARRDEVGEQQEEEEEAIRELKEKIDGFIREEPANENHFGER